MGNPENGSDRECCATLVSIKQMHALPAQNLNKVNLLTLQFMICCTALDNLHTSRVTPGPSVTDFTLKDMPSSCALACLAMGFKLKEPLMVKAFDLLLAFFRLRTDIVATNSAQVREREQRTFYKHLKDILMLMNNIRGFIGL